MTETAGDSDAYPRGQCSCDKVLLQAMKWAFSAMIGEQRSPGGPHRVSGSREGRTRRRRAVRRRRWVVAIALLVVAASLLVWASSPGQDSHPRSASAKILRASHPAQQSPPMHFVVRRLPLELPAALQDAAAALLGSERIVLLGGLNAADVSIDSVSVLDRQGLISSARLPEAQHDAQGVLLGGQVYVFGGGQVASYSHILSYDPASGSVTVAGKLPAPTSDAEVAVVAGTAYVVGGYDGRQALDTVVAWRPGEPARIVARLPYGLRYAAVASSGGRVVIVGGSREEVATTAILSFDPYSGRVRGLGELPDPVTHAAAVALGSYVYVFGGRNVAPGSQTDAIIAIDPHTGRAVRVGQLPASLSDAAAIPFGNTVWLAGGLSASGEPLATVFELTPAAS